MNRNMAVRPLPTPSFHQPFLPVGPLRHLADWVPPVDCISAVEPGADGASTLTSNWPCTAVLPLTVTFSVLHVTPGGKVADGQLTVTCPVKPPVGVTVTVVFAEPPAVTLTGDAVATGLGSA